MCNPFLILGLAPNELPIGLTREPFLCENRQMIVNTHLRKPQMPALMEFQPDGEVLCNQATSPGSEGLHKIHLAPANGLPVASYRHLMACFAGKYRFSGADYLGAWPYHAPPRTGFSWADHADNLLATIAAKHSPPVIGMGHSMGGAVTLLAARKRPDLFSRLVIIDPATFSSPLQSLLYRLIPQSLSFRLFPFIRRTRNRKRHWASRDEFCDNYRNHPTYRGFDADALRDYASHGLVQRADGGLELVYSPEWEAYNFRRLTCIWNILKDITHPTLLLRAEHTTLYSAHGFARHCRGLPGNFTVQTIAGANHLVTHEMPEVLSGQILAWLQAGTMSVKHRP